MVMRKWRNPNQGKRRLEKPKIRGEGQPSLSAGLEASCLCSRPSHSLLSGNQGDLRRPSRQESETSPTERKKHPRARPAPWRYQWPRLPHKGDREGTWEPVSPHRWGPRWSRKALWVCSPSSHVPPINGPATWQSALTIFIWGHPKGHVAGKQRRGHNGGTVTGGMGPG